jgi:hypothetical protein
LAPGAEAGMTEPVRWSGRMRFRRKRTASQRRTASVMKGFVRVVRSGILLVFKMVKWRETRQ